MAIWCILWSFRTFFPRFGMLYRKNLATLIKYENEFIYLYKHGANDMITTSCDFYQFSAEKWRFS
jgi:hypothetical protein